MDIQTHFIFDNFFPSAHLMRQKIDEHFTEATAGKLPFDKRGIWNYWYIPKLYMYLRCEPWRLFPELYEEFMAHLRAFAARQFGMVIPTQPFLSMYVNGCVQNIHNDANNGRLAYVFSLTNWKERHFQGGETFVYKIAHDAYDKSFVPTYGWGFYDFIEPEFNRLGLFDDRLPHAVNEIHGTMNPLDSRLALHGHMQEPEAAIPYIEGGLAGADLTPQWQQIKEPVRQMFQSHGKHGAITLEISVDGDGSVSNINVRYGQLLALPAASRSPAQCIEEAVAIVRSVGWPAAGSPSTLVFALGAGALRS